MLFIDLETLEFESFISSDVEIVRGIGLRTVQLMVNKGADTLITHYCGSFCYQTLTTTGIKIITGVRGPVMDAVKKFKNGEFEYAKGPNIHIPSQKDGKDKKDFIKKVVEPMEKN